MARIVLAKLPLAARHTLAVQVAESLGEVGGEHIAQIGQRRHHYNKEYDKCDNAHRTLRSHF